MNKLAVERHLALNQNVFATGWISFSCRQESNTCCLSHSTIETSKLHVGALRSVNCPQGLLELSNGVDNLWTVGCESPRVETNIAIAASTVCVVLHTFCFHNWGWCGTLLPRHEGRNWSCWCWGIGFVEAAVVCLDESVTTSSICEVIHAKSIWLHLCTRNWLGVFTSENWGVRSAVYGALK